MKIIREIFGFLITFGVIFSIAFVVLNFSAVKSAVEFYISGDEKQVVLDERLGNLEKEVILLPPKGAKKLVKKEFPPLDIDVTPTDFRLVIPKIGRDVPLVGMSDEYISDDLWGEFEKEVQSALRNGVVHYPGTAAPGEYGNVFLTGHSSFYPWDPGQYKDVFVSLGQLEVGDEYFIYYNQEKYRYVVREKKEVKPTEVGVLEQPKGEKLSTLMTCWPLGTTLRRLIVVAEEV